VVGEGASVGWDKTELRGLFAAFKAMQEEAIQQSKAVSGDLATKMADYIKGAARNSTRARANSKVADNVKVSKSSKIGEFGYGYKSQRLFSGGASTLDMVYGSEFGSINYPQFPPKSPRTGNGKAAGYFIYPTLRQKQPEIVKLWEQAFDQILKEYN